jgi:hypothetical protein
MIGFPPSPESVMNIALRRELVNREFKKKLGL